MAVVYVPAQWRDFFVMVGTAAATLTGLVFVAMTLNLRAISRDATHRYRAIGTLAGLVSIFTVCALALMGGGHRVWLGAEWLAVAAIAAPTYAYGHVASTRAGGSAVDRRLSRTILGTACYLVQIAGAALLVAGFCVGAYVAGVAMTAFFSLLVSGAWLLIVGVHQSMTGPPDAG